MKAEEREELYKQFSGLQKKTKSLILGTVGKQGLPRISYAPYVRMTSGEFCIYLSRLSEHTTELIGNPVASVLLIEDESEASQIFARMRISFLCDAMVIDRGNSEFKNIMNLFAKRFGSIVDLLTSLPDFVLFRLVPRSGRFIIGFGQAYDLSGEQLDELTHIGPEQLKRN